MGNLGKRKITNSSASWATVTGATGAIKTILEFFSCDVVVITFRLDRGFTSTRNQERCMQFLHPRYRYHRHSPSWRVRDLADFAGTPVFPNGADGRHSRVSIKCGLGRFRFNDGNSLLVSFF